MMANVPLAGPGRPMLSPIIPFQLPEAPPEPAGDASEGPTWCVTAVGADASPYDGSGVSIAVLDTGYDETHSAFADLSVEQKDFTGEGPGDDNGHGTHNAALLCGGTVDGTRIGVAPGVERLLVGKVLGGTGGGSTSTIAAGLVWAITSGAHIVALPLGVDFPGMVHHLVDQGFPVDVAASKALVGARQYLRAFEGMAAVAATEGSLIVAAVGNGSRRDTNLNYIIDADAPAAAEGIVAVGALEQTDSGYKIASFSNAGADICGPGVGVISAKLGGGVRALSGTAMATPLVAGVAALWAQRLLETNAFSAESLRASLLGNAKPLDIPYADAGVGLAFAPQDRGSGNSILGWAAPRLPDSRFS